MPDWKSHCVPPLTNRANDVMEQWVSTAATGHQIVDYSEPQEEAEAVLLANNLLRHLARAVLATRTRGRPRTRRSRQP